LQNSILFGNIAVAVICGLFIVLIEDLSSMLDSASEGTGINNVDIAVKQTQIANIADIIVLNLPVILIQSIFLFCTF
jgi:hypothetical protein